MIDYLVGLIFKWDNLRRAVIDEVHMYDSVGMAMLDSSRKNLSWTEEDGLWRGWIFSEELNKYFFDDAGHDDFLELFESNIEWEIAAIDKVS